MQTARGEHLHSDFAMVRGGWVLWTWNTIVQAPRAKACYEVTADPTSNPAIKTWVLFHNAVSSGDPSPNGLATTNVKVVFKKNDGTDMYSNRYVSDAVQVGISGHTFNFIVPLCWGKHYPSAFYNYLPRRNG